MIKSYDGVLAFLERKLEEHKNLSKKAKVYKLRAGMVLLADCRIELLNSLIEEVKNAKEEFDVS